KWNAREVIGHHVRAFADGRRGLHLAVERGTPFKRRAFDGDFAFMLGVEALDQRLHAHAVAATEEVPPHDGFLRLYGTQQQRGCGRRQHSQLETLVHVLPPFGVCPHAIPQLGGSLAKRRPRRYSDDRDAALNFSSWSTEPPSACLQLIVSRR